MSETQAVLFDKTKWIPSRARKWLKTHKLTPIKRVHVTSKYLRYRIEDPKFFKRLRIKKITDSIKFVIGFL